MPTRRHRDDGAGVHVDGLPGRLDVSVDQQVLGGPGDRDEEVVLGQDRQLRARHLDHRCGVGVAHEDVAGARRVLVRRAVGRDADLGQTGAAEVLDHRVTDAPDPDHPARPAPRPSDRDSVRAHRVHSDAGIGRNRNVSPGSWATGGTWSTRNSRTGVRPMIRQPPGDGAG